MIKHCFIFINTILWATGALFLGIGVWFWVDQSFSNYVVAFVQEVDGFESTMEVRTVAYIFVAIGIAVFLIGMVACIGAVRDIQCLLGWFIFLMTFVLIIELASGIIAAVYRNQILDRIDSEAKLFVKERYNNNNEADFAWNYIQFEWECCGVDTPRDYMYSKFTNETQTNDKVPPFCCRMKPDYVFKERQPDTFNGANCQFEAQACFNNKQSCDSNVVTTNDLRQKPCSDEVVAWIRRWLPLFMGVAIGVFLVQLIVYSCAIYVCRNMGKAKKADRYRRD